MLPYAWRYNHSSSWWDVIGCNSFASRILRLVKNTHGTWTINCLSSLALGGGAVATSSPQRRSICNCQSIVARWHSKAAFISCSTHPATAAAAAAAARGRNCGGGSEGQLPPGAAGEGAQNSLTKICMGWNDVTVPMVTIFSPFCGYNLTKCVELIGENFTMLFK